MSRNRWVKLVLFAVLLVGIGWGLKGIGVDLGSIHPERIREAVLRFGIWAPLIYVVAYGQPFIPLPASVMTITGGLTFGPAWGTLAALIGATLRACGQFGLARLLGRQAIEKWMKGRVAGLDQKIGQHGFKTVLLIRLIPNLPFDVQNFGLGFSRIRFPVFALATFLGMIPGAFAYVYLGYSLTDPKHLWKLGVAVGIIIALMLIQHAWTRRHPKNAQ